MNAYKFNPRPSFVLAYVKNTPEIRARIKKFNKLRQEAIKLKCFGRAPSCLRRQNGRSDTTLAEAPILAVYWMDVNWNTKKWNEIVYRWTAARPDSKAMPKWLREARLPIKPIYS